MHLPAPVTFMFMDECTSEALNTASLTAVLVPSDHYAVVRDTLCRLVRDVIGGSQGTIPPSIELHANDLLAPLKGTGIDDVELDRRRMLVFRTVVDLVNVHRLHVVRTAYTNWREAAIHLGRFDPKMLAVLYSGIEWMIGPHARDTLLVPIMDGVPDTSDPQKKAPRVDAGLIRAFAMNARTLHHLRAHDLGEGNLSIAHPWNLVEPSFGDSAHSVMLQLVDLVSYLLHTVDRAELRPQDEMRGYRAAVLAEARRVEKSLVRSHRGTLEHISGTASMKVTATGTLTDASTDAVAMTPDSPADTA